MKRWIVNTMIIFIVCLFAIGSGADDEPEKRVMDFIAVMDFKCGKIVSKGNCAVLTDIAIEELVRIKKYKVIDRANRDKILGEAAFQQTGCVEGACTVEAGRILGVGKIVVGSVSKLGQTYIVTLQIVNVETAEVETAEKERCKKCEIDDLVDTVTNAARKLMGEKTTPVSSNVTSTPSTSQPYRYTDERDRDTTSTARVEPGGIGTDWNTVRATLRNPLTIKIGTLAPKNTEWIKFPNKVLYPHMKKVSGGKVIFKTYTGGVMGEDVDILRKMDTGQMDGCGCTALGVLKAAPEVSVFTLPFLFRNYKEVDYILGKFRPEIEAEFEKKGYILAALVDTGFHYLWTKNRISSLSDIKRLKMVTWFGTVETSTLKELGIRPTPISVPEIVTSLNTGLVDAVIGPAPWILGTQAYTNLHYYVTTPLFYSPAAIIISKKVKDQFRGSYSNDFTNNFFKLIIHETTSMERKWKRKLSIFENKCILAFKEHGIKPVNLSREDVAAIDAASKRVWTQLAGRVYSKDLLDRVLRELENYRKQ